VGITLFGGFTTEYRSYDKMDLLAELKPKERTDVPQQGGMCVRFILAKLNLG